MMLNVYIENGNLQVSNSFMGVDDDGYKYMIYENSGTFTLYASVNSYRDVNFYIVGINTYTGDILSVDWTKSTTEPAGNIEWDTSNNYQTQTQRTGTVQLELLKPSTDGSCYVGNATNRFGEAYINRIVIDEINSPVIKTSSNGYLVDGYDDLLALLDARYSPL